MGMRCRTCSATVTGDADPRRGYFAGEVWWGPNLLDGVVNETVITSYVVLLVDSCGSFLATVGQLNVRQGSSTECCAADWYILRVEIQLPAAAHHFMIHGVQNGPTPFYV